LWPPTAAAAQRRIGGPVDLGPPGAPVTLRVLLDHSCCEAFLLSSGAVLSTRLYRGSPPPGADAGVDLVAYGGAAVVERVDAWEMGTADVAPGGLAAASLGGPAVKAAEGVVGGPVGAPVAAATAHRPPQPPQPPPQAVAL
jgi:hypothetical protein